MISVLEARLNKLERSIPAPEKQWRVICIVAGERDRAEAERLLETEGCDPESDLAIFHTIVSPAGQEP